MPPDGAIAFQSTEVETFWRYISSSMDRLVGMLDGMSPEVVSWRPNAPDTNSIFTLANHTLENARTNLLGNLCGQAVVRDRASEFTAEPDPANQDALMACWTGLRHEMQGALSRLPANSLSARHPHHWRGDITGLELLIIVARHAAEHLGQAELTRDLAIAALGDAYAGSPKLAT